MVFSVVIICLFGRDFGPMLTAERLSTPPTLPPPAPPSRGSRTTSPCSPVPPQIEDEIESNVDDVEEGEQSRCCPKRKRVGGDNSAVSVNAELQHCGKDEDLDESVFTGE